MKALDLFSGAGGMALGAEMAGIEVIAAVDADRHALESYAHNFKHVKIFHEDIREFINKSNSYKVDIVFAGPPCQGFSTSNQRTRTTNNPNNWLFKELLQIVEKIKPEWVIVENVRGLVETANGYFIKQILDGLSKIGYLSSYKILNASNFGVPQNRSRLFIIGNREGNKFTFPEGNNKQFVTVGDAIYDLPLLQNGASKNEMPYRSCAPSEYASKIRNSTGICTNNIVTRNANHIVDRYHHIRQGGNWECIPDHLMNNYRDKSRCHTGIYHRLCPDKPSVVIGNFRKNMLIHPNQNRGLSVREAARIQSFPDWFEFLGSIGFQQQQVGNAVPPLLAKAVFNNIMMA